MAAPRQASSDLSFFSKSKSSKPGASNANESTVTTRVVTVQRTVRRAPDPKAGALKVAARSATPIASSSAQGRHDNKKRKSSEPEVPPAQTKKPRVSTPSLSSARSQGLTPTQARASASTPSTQSPAPSRRPSRPPSIAQSPMLTQPDRQSRSRSVSAFPAEAPAPRECWIEEDGRPGPGFASSEVVVRDLMKTYKSYFTNPNDPADKTFEPHPTQYPVTELEYPNSAACERFILLVPKDKDHYNPIMCLESSLHTIIQCYLTPAQQSLFGTLPASSLPDDEPPGLSASLPAISILEAAEALSPPSSVPSSAPSPASSLDSSSSSSSSLSSVSSISSISSVSSVSSLSSISSLSSLTELSSHASQTSLAGPPTVNYLRLLQRAINKRDGPLFLKVMTAINALLRLLKYPPVPADPFEPVPPNHFMETVKSWNAIPKGVLMRIIDETYQRAVGPYVSELKHYEAFSSEVYGELMPSLISQIVQATGLNANSLFVDLGSGVGNVVMQASLQTGCRSFGVEIMPTPAKIARSQLEQFKMRCRMWGVTMGEVELEEADMLKSRKVDELVPQADVVLVNNKVFLESLNEALRSKFLDLKEGAIVVSLKPFVSSTRLTERNLDDISAIFQVTEQQYYPGSVSWGNGRGSYFLHRVDRVGYADIKRRFESSRTTVSRSTRFRR